MRAGSAGPWLPWVAGVWSLAAWLWAAAVVGAPVAAARVGASAEPASLAQPLAAGRLLIVTAYAAGARLCHQRADRSFHWHGVQAPVCARCTGIYLSLGMGLLFGWLRRPSGLPPAPIARRLLTVAALPVVATVVVEWLTAAPPGNLVRLSSAVPLGLSLGWLTVAALAARPQPLGGPRPSPLARGL